MGFELQTLVSGHMGAGAETQLVLFCASLRPIFQFKNYWGLCVACLWNSKENPVLVTSVLPLYTSSNSDCQAWQ